MVTIPGLRCHFQPQNALPQPLDPGRVVPRVIPALILSPMSGSNASNQTPIFGYRSGWEKLSFENNAEYWKRKSLIDVGALIQRADARSQLSGVKSSGQIDGKQLRIEGSSELRSSIM